MTHIRWVPEPPGGLRSDESKGLLALPTGQRVEYFLRLPAGATVSIEEVGRPTESQTAVRISVQPIGGPEVILSDAAAGSGPLDLPLPWKDAKIAMLAFEARATAAEAHVFLRRPVVMAPRQQKDSPASTTAPSNPPNLIVYLIDTLRADHLGAYGYHKPISARLDEFAATATVFEDAVAQSPWTRASVASILTGLDPHQHGVNGRDDSLPEQATTVAELLAEHGYQTAAFVTNGNAGEAVGLAQGFETYWRPQGNYDSDLEVARKATEYLRSADLRQPFFLYLHLLDPHDPYLPREDIRRLHAGEVEDVSLGEQPVLKRLKKERRGLRLTHEVDPVTRDIVSLYDAEIAIADEAFGVVVDELHRLGLYDDSLILVLADHGEEFWDHGDWAHGHSLHREVLQVPLIVKEPGQTQGRRDSSLVQQTDVMPTLLESAGIQVPEGLRGASLRRSSPPTDGFAYSVMDLDERTGTSITTSEWKLILRENHRGKRMPPLLFLRTTDPDEHEDVHGANPVALGYLTTLANMHQDDPFGTLPSETVDPLDQELADEMRALGYLQ